MSLPKNNNHSQIHRFENLPDEILLCIYRYLSPLHILNGFLNINQRINKAIWSYQERFYLSHLSRTEFDQLIHKYLPLLAKYVRYLYINGSSMIDVGPKFERQFNRIDQEFPLLSELTFHQIDIETLENLAWRFSTMPCLRKLNIYLNKDRLSSMPPYFDEFLCGKLFIGQSKIESVTLNLHKYKFNLDSIKNKCDNIRQLTMSVKRLNDLLILFDHLPNIEYLDITIGCGFKYDSTDETYSYDHLWWKVPYLTKLNFTIEEKEVLWHENIIPISTILKIVSNIYYLSYFKFKLLVSFSLSLQSNTTRDFYLEKYLPYIDGRSWEEALKRNNSRSIAFELYIELDGVSLLQLKRKDIDELIPDKKHNVEFVSQLKSTFSSEFWLQKNISFDCWTSTSKQIIIYTLPPTNSFISTMLDIVDQQISVNSLKPFYEVESLHINSNIQICLPKLSIIHLFQKYPSLMHLAIDTALILPPVTIICSNRIRSLSLTNYSINACGILLDYLPQVMSLSIKNLYSSTFDIENCSKVMNSIVRLKLTIDWINSKNIINLISRFPKLKEFHLIIKQILSGNANDFIEDGQFQRILQDFNNLRYFEMSVPSKNNVLPMSHLSFLLRSVQDKCKITDDLHSATIKLWL